jgi:putative spermidine/putrescine transport system substrate-binding protein
VVGTTWQVIVNLAQGEKAPVEAILPDEGATGWSDTWMVSSETENPNCAYAWLDHIISPEANAAVAEWFGEAPANGKACDLTSEGFCESFHAGDEAYAEQIHYWTTPIEECLDGRTDVQCTTYQDWTQAWTEIKG